jgi:prepilin-type N-terminal cleavage/methylation domain-containing protein
MINNKGFTLTEMMVVIIIIAIIFIGGYVVLFKSVVTGNAWYSPVGVIHELKMDHPEVKSFVKDQRNFIGLSVITVEVDNSTGLIKNNDINITIIDDVIRKDFCLDTDILWNYEFVPCPES